MYTLDQLHRTLFLDIETVSQKPKWEDLEEKWQRLWGKKHVSIQRFFKEEMTPDQSYRERAAIYSEFGQIVCISVGLIAHTEAGEMVRLKSYAGEDEKELLMEFSDLLNSHYSTPESHFLCGHNIREFDIPYIARRMVIHGLPIPRILEVRGKKPWELHHFVDTLEMWKFGDFKSFISLDLLTQVLDVESPKGAMDGSEVGEYYWNRDGLEEICAYCERDVVAVIQVLRRLCGIDPLPRDHVRYEYPQPESSEDTEE